MAGKSRKTLNTVRKIIEREGAKHAPWMGKVEPEVRTDLSLPVPPSTERPQTRTRKAPRGG